MALGTVATRATSGDGVIEINQHAAVAGDITAGDTAGFPVTLSVEGGYRLTSNLAVSAGVMAVSTHGIDV